MATPPFSISMAANETTFLFDLGLLVYETDPRDDIEVIFDEKSVTFAKVELS